MTTFMMICVAAMLGFLAGFLSGLLTLDRRTLTKGSVRNAVSDAIKKVTRERDEQISAEWGLCKCGKPMDRPDGTQCWACLVEATG